MSVLKCRSCVYTGLSIIDSSTPCMACTWHLWPIDAEIKHLGQNNPSIAKSRESRVQHFLDGLVSMKRDIVDSYNALQEIAKETPAFSKAQRDTMASAVSAYMQGSDVAIFGKSNRMQNHPNITGALTESLWSVICDAQLSLDDKSQEFVKHCVAILGLRKPNDATLKDILGILEMCSKKELTPDERRKQLNNSITCNHSLNRGLLKSNARAK